MQSICDKSCDNIMVLPAKQANDIRLVRMPRDYENHEAYRHVTGLIAEIEEANPQYQWDDIADILEEHGFEPLRFVLGPSLD